ncbi:MAG: biotin--[acetyl-CoA-carboxylase] ligase [Rickettsiales bacterium]|nr:biotin--[acetyl-CoA-carboxylase] ligase [Rickettsiales bacterium]|tara:strand:+ start:14739 stop:15527 length:789 start_codon:yes stop_codon:yes gene_type:complete
MVIKSLSKTPAPLFQFDAVQSTMDEAVQVWLKKKDELLAQACGSLLAIIQANEQVAGRGRRGRTWLSPTGGLYVSYLVRVPANHDPKSHQLSLLTAVALGKALSEIGVPYTLKWPNDVLINTQKIAGILIEHVEPGVYCIGVGVNIANTDGLVDLGYPVSVMEMGAKLTHFLEQQLAQWLQEGFEKIRQFWLEHSWTKKVSVKVISGDNVHYGCYDGINAEGFLLCTLANGKQKTFSAADVSLQQTNQKKHMLNEDFNDEKK